MSSSRLVPLDSPHAGLEEVDAVTDADSRSVVGRAWVYNILPYDNVVVGVSVIPGTSSGTGSRSTWTVKMSTDGIGWVNPPDGSTTVTAGAATSILACGGYAYLKIEAATASSYTTEFVAVSAIGNTLG